MTEQELKDYNRLTPEGKKFYDLYKGMHPEWNHSPQLMTMVSICCQNPFNGDKMNVPNPTTKEIIAECIRRADKYMEENFPGIYPSVRAFFTSITNAIRRVAEITWDFIVKLFN